MATTRETLVLKTERLRLRWFTLEDAPFALKLLNEPAFLRFIGDKGVRDLDDARRYLENGPLASYRKFGFGLYAAELKESGVPVGMCGLISRDTLDDVDIGYAFLAAYRGLGYAFESGAATLTHGRDTFNLTRIVAITSPDNERSKRLLDRLGLVFEQTLIWSDGEPVSLYATTADF